MCGSHDTPAAFAIRSRAVLPSPRLPWPTSYVSFWTSIKTLENEISHPAGSAPHDGAGLTRWQRVAASFRSAAARRPSLRLPDSAPAGGLLDDIGHSLDPSGRVPPQLVTLRARSSSSV